MAGSYYIYFNAAQRGNYQQHYMQVRLLVDGVSYGVFQPPSTSYTAYWTAPFNITAGTHTIAFQGINPYGDDNTIFLDQFQIAPTWSGGDNFGRINNYNSSHFEFASAAGYIQSKISSWPTLIAYPWGEYSAYMANTYLPTYGSEHHAVAAFTLGETYVTRSSPRWALPRISAQSTWGVSGTTPDLYTKVLQYASQ